MLSSAWPHAAVKAIVRTVLSTCVGQDVRMVSGPGAKATSDIPVSGLRFLSALPTGCLYTCLSTDTPEVVAPSSAWKHCCRWTPVPGEKEGEGGPGLRGMKGREVEVLAEDADKDKDFNVADLDNCKVTM